VSQSYRLPRSVTGIPPLYICITNYEDRLYGLVVRVLGYRSRGLGSIPGSTEFSEK
jgi:hypothetical protein